MAMSKSEQVRLLAEKTPITRTEDYMGKEHFRYFGELAGEPPRNSGEVFNTLLNPHFKVGQFTDHGVAMSRYREHGIQIAKRPDVGLGPLPDFMSQPDTREIAKYAMMAGSVIYLAQHQEVLRHFRGFTDEYGNMYASLLTLGAIAEVAQSKIAEGIL